MPYVEFDGNSYYYAGDPSREGTPVIFCHGSGGGHHHWLYQVKKLKKSINPIAVDLPGHGRSGGEPADDIALYRDWLHRFRQAVGLPSCLIAGHSLGGGIALAYALEYPEDVLGLILVGTGARLRVLPAFLEMLKEGKVPSALVDYSYGPEVSEELLEKGKQETANTAASIYLADLSACDQFDIMTELHSITCPCLIICGSEDRLTPSKYSLYLQENIPGSRAIIIEGAGHMVMLEKAHTVNDAIIAFVENEITRTSRGEN